MVYRVKSGDFEGPFDLLLELVTRQKIDISSISIAEIADQYLAEIASMELMDLDVASDFLLVAATLLEIKAATLLSETPQADDAATLENLKEQQSLLERLLRYKTYKEAASALQLRLMLQQRRHGRFAGPDESFLYAMPDFLADVSLGDLAKRAATLLGRRELAIMEAEHIASETLSVERYAQAIDRLIRVKQRLKFSELIACDPSPAVVVVNFLAMLELCKQHVVTFTQKEAFGDIVIEMCDEPRTPPSKTPVSVEKEH